MPETFLTARWEQLIMANYALPPAVLEPYLPKGVEVDLRDGMAWASLVGFLFRRTRIFGLPVPLLGNFEEINLRLYVKRREGNETRRGVVFVNETVPYRAVAWMANLLYKEHYMAVPTRHRIEAGPLSDHIRYEWKTGRDWNHLAVQAGRNTAAMPPDSMEAFIFEHYYGYTRIDAERSEEYEVQHPSWEVRPVLDYSIACDFGRMYGPDFAFLGDAKPHSVFLAAGSDVRVKWKRRRL
jgi:uncharacterized protein